MTFKIPTTKEMPAGLERFARIPHAWFEDKALGKLTKNEFNALLWVVVKTNPYKGYAVITTAELANGIGKSTDYTGEILHALHSKRYIHFNAHKGVRSGFEVAVHGYRLADEGDWVNLANKDFTSLLRSKPVARPVIPPVQTPKVVPLTPRSSDAGMKSIKDISSMPWRKTPKSIDDSDSGSN